MNDAKVTSDFERALARIPGGYCEGTFRGGRWGVSVKRSPDARRIWLFAEELGGTESISFNLYRLPSSGALLKPCEMSADTVIAFVLAFEPFACR